MQREGDQRGSRHEHLEMNLGEWRRIIVLYECDGMNICTIKYQNKHLIEKALVF